MNNDSNLSMSEKRKVNLKVSRVPFNEYDFIRLFLAYLRINGCIFINKDRLRYDLYNMYQNKEYKELFQDIAVKQQIEGNFLDIEEALHSAELYGLLSFHDTNSSCSRRMILINEDESFSIIDSYEDIYKSMMDELVGEFFNNTRNKDIRYHFEGKIKQLKKKNQQSK